MNVRVVFNLENSRLDLSVSTQVNQKSTVEVGNSNLFGKSKSFDFLHGVPSFVDRYVGESHFSSRCSVPPFGRVTDFRIHI